MINKRILEHVETTWKDSIIPELVEYISIPNQSPLFDPDWHAHGFMDDAVALIEDWCVRQPIKNINIEVIRLEGRTPLIFMNVPGDGDDCVILYGHFDKQPEMTGWEEDLGPWKPVLRDEKLYGRGGADDGYSAFAALTAIAALQEQQIPHARCVVLIEGCEESGSYDLPYYIDALATRIGTPSLVICLDSGCGNYDQLWCTTSLRGLVSGTLSIENLKEAVHSGDAGGIVPSTFRILRQLLSRLEDEDTGLIQSEVFNVDIPSERITQAAQVAEVLGDAVYGKFPFLNEAGPTGDDLKELVLNRTWRPAMEVVGAAGLPSLVSAGNVARPMTSVKISLRIPPTCDAVEGTRVLKKLLESDPPYGAVVRFSPDTPCAGWNAPPVSPWLERSLNNASRDYFGATTMYTGEGVTIPFMSMLGEKFPQTQYLVTGVLGPQSNAHGPNEFLHIPTARNITCCVAQVLADHYEHSTT